jgi:hypothetical protein
MSLASIRLPNSDCSLLSRQRGSTFVPGPSAVMRSDVAPYPKRSRKWPFGRSCQGEGTACVEAWIWCPAQSCPALADCPCGSSRSKAHSRRCSAAAVSSARTKDSALSPQQARTKLTMSLEFTSDRCQILVQQLALIIVHYSGPLFPAGRQTLELPTAFIPNSPAITLSPPPHSIVPPPCDLLTVFSRFLADPPNVTKPN